MNSYQSLLGTKTVNVAVGDENSRLQRSTCYSTTYTLTKPEMVTHIRVLEPHEVADTAIALALESITEMLCKSAAERLSSGECPTTESVIEIVCIKSGAGRLSTEQWRQDRHVFVHRINSSTAISRDIKSQSSSQFEHSPSKRRKSDEILQVPKKSLLTSQKTQYQTVSNLHSIPITFKEEITDNSDVDGSPHLDDTQNGEIGDVGLSDESQESGCRANLTIHVRQYIYYYCVCQNCRFM